MSFVPSSIHSNGSWLSGIYICINANKLLSNFNHYVQLQYIDYIIIYHVCPCCLLFGLLLKRKFCFLSFSACSLLQHLGVYLNERNCSCISTEQHQNKIHNPQRQSHDINFRGRMSF